MSNYRSPKLLKLASEAPHCFYCREPNEGQVVACHSNSQRFGKGLSLKAHDAPVAMLCLHCHQLVDGVLGPHLSKHDREAIWYEGVAFTWLWLMLEGHLEVK